MHPGAVVAERWEILAPLGRGGMGDVYRVRHRLTRAEAALKVVRTHGTYSEEDAERFSREASAPARIGHPRIAAVLDAGVDAATRQLYLVTELLVGDTLRAFMGPGAVPRLVEVLEPLAAAHAAGFVHRDLKPENVFVDRARGVVLFDFGLARSHSDRVATGEGQMMGTPYYMAPEQAMSARDATPAADVWAIGVMLYEAIAGRRPFEAETVHALVAELHHAHHTPLSLAAPGTPPALSALVDRCLDKHPSRRPSDAGALLRELRAMDLSALSGTRRPPGPTARIGVDATAATLPSGPALVAVKPPRRRSRIALVAAGVAVVLLLGLGATGGAVWYTWLRTRTERGIGWAIDVPNDWEAMPPPNPEFVAVFGAPFDEAEGGSRPTLSVWRQRYGGSLEDYVSDSVNHTVENGGFIERNVQSTLSGLPAREVEVLVRGYQLGSYTQAQRVVVVNHTAWVVSCSGSATGFDEIRPICRDVWSSTVIAR